MCISKTAERYGSGEFKMIISKKGCVAALKEAHKKGYEIVPNGTRISVYTGNWAMEMQTRDLPIEVSQILVEHYGGLPVEPMFVQKNKENQTMLNMDVKDRTEELIEQQDKPRYMHRIPVIYRDQWVMFGTVEGDWVCIDQRYVDILESLGLVSVMMTDSGMALFANQDERLTVAPARFGKEDTVKLQKIADMYTDQKIVPLDIPENMCLFDDMERE